MSELDKVFAALGATPRKPAPEQQRTRPVSMTAAELRQLLEAAGVSQLELARRMRVDGRTVRRWLTGERSISLAVAKKIRKKLTPG